MKLSRGAGLIFGFIMGAMMAFLFVPRKGKDFIRRFKKEVREGRTGLRAVKESFTGMGREIIEVGTQEKQHKPRNLWQRKK
jgi:gas vesicle protein